MEVFACICIIVFAIVWVVSHSRGDKQKQVTQMLREEEAEARPSAGEIIISSIVQHGDALEVQDEEKKFAEALGEQLQAAQLSPGLLRLYRIGLGGFNVRYGDGLYVGKICLRDSPDKWAVKRPNASRATRVFGDELSAVAFQESKPDYVIERRPGENLRFMQYLKVSRAVKNLERASLEKCLDVANMPCDVIDVYATHLGECIAAIPYWITYIQDYLYKQKAINRHFDR